MSIVISKVQALVEQSKRNPAIRFQSMPNAAMSPSITPNDCICIDYGRRQFTDGIFAIKFMGVTEIRRLSVCPGGRVRVISDNPKYPDRDLTRDDVQILGRVLGIIKVEEFAS